jgi:hypothetical protein
MPEPGDYSPGKPVPMPKPEGLSAVEICHRLRSWGATFSLFPDEDGIERLRILVPDVDLNWEMKAWLRNWIHYAMVHHKEEVISLLHKERG